MSLPPAGYYPDPEDPSRRRYWDGTRWTEERVDLGPVAPGPGPAVVVAPDPWLWQSIVATIVCCLPLGIPGIVYAARSSEAARRGDLAAARAAAGTARTFVLWSVGLGLLTLVGYALLFMVGVVAGL